jgi:hypothetical protein
LPYNIALEQNLDKNLCRLHSSFIVPSGENDSFHTTLESFGVGCGWDFDYFRENNSLIGRKNKLEKLEKV